MSNLNLECPFHHIELKLGESCPKCDYNIQNTFEKNFRFLKTDQVESIYESYENAYDQLAVDDLESAIYAEEYQFDLAIQTHKAIGQVRGLDIAEFGVGRGFLQKSFLSENPRSLHVLDIAEEYIKNASKIFNDLNNSSTNFSTSVGNVEFMPFLKSFDLVVATDILEHVLNLGNALVRISRSLKVGGKFVCRVPYREKLGQYSVYNNQKYEFAHLRFFDESLLKIQLEEVGLKPLLVKKNGFQQGRFRKFVPDSLVKYLAKSFLLFRVYGQNWYEFNRKSKIFSGKTFQIISSTSRAFDCFTKDLIFILFKCADWQEF